MAKAQLVTKLERGVLSRAAGENDGGLRCPGGYDPRIWMLHLAKLHYKGYIDRKGRECFISELGRAALRASVSGTRLYGNRAMMGAGLTGPVA